MSALKRFACYIGVENETAYLFDYSATCPVDPRVAEKMAQYMTMDGTFGNPASRSHRYGWQAEEAVDTAREQIADLLNADPREIVFTSGATESDNLPLKELLVFMRKKVSILLPVKLSTKPSLTHVVNWSVKVSK